MLLQRIIQNFGYRQSCYRTCLSTVQVVNNENVTKKVSKETSKREWKWIPDEIRNQLNESNLDYFIDKLPKKILRKRFPQRTSLYLINKNVAKQLSAMMSEDLLKNPSCIIECNPGFGLLTQELLNAGIPKINLFEKTLTFLVSESPLEKLFIEYESRVQLRKLNFFDIWLLLLHDKFCNEILAETYLADAPYHDWKDETFAQIIAVCSNRTFVSLLIHNFFNQTSIFDHGRPSFFLILPYPIWERLITNNANYQKGRYYTHYSVMLNLFFEYKELGRVPRKAFVPWNKEKSNASSNESDIPFVVVKLEPKKDTDSILTKKDFKAFWYFLKHCMRTRKNRVIEQFEKFVPGCGPKLIEKDINICTTFKELSPKELLELFKMFKSCPEYDENLFIPLLLVGDEEKKEDEEKLFSEEELKQEPLIMNPTSIDVTNEERNR